MWTSLYLFGRTVVTNEKTLSAADIRYLLTIADLYREGIGIRCVDIASAMHLSKPSVHSRMKAFAETGLVEKESYGVVYLTEAGRTLAERYQVYANGVISLLHTYFPNLPEENKTECLCMMLSAIPETDLRMLADRQQNTNSYPT